MECSDAGGLDGWSDSMSPCLTFSGDACLLDELSLVLSPSQVSREMRVIAWISHRKLDRERLLLHSQSPPWTHVREACDSSGSFTKPIAAPRYHETIRRHQTEPYKTDAAAIDMKFHSFDS